MLAKTSDYYPQANGNWDALIGAFNMSASVYLEDIKLFNNTLTQFYLGNLNRGYCTSMGALPNYIYKTGESQESNRDQVHARMGISGLAYKSDIAWNQGIDIYGAYDNRLLTGTLYSASYCLGNEVESETFISDKTRDKSDISSMVYEIVGNHYKNQVNEYVDTSSIYNAAERLLRTGDTLNEGKQKAEYYGAMIFTDKRYDVNLELLSDKNVLSKIGDKLVITANVNTESKLKM